MMKQREDMLRGAEREKYEERERIWQLEQPIKMREKYGPNWYQYVAQTDEDCDKADDLRRDADHSSFLREKEEEKCLVKEYIVYLSCPPSNDIREL